MELPLTRNALPQVHCLNSAGSTNAVLRELVDEALEKDHALPHGTLVATANQTAGRGRNDRDWVTPPDTALAVSVLLQPEPQAAANGATASGSWGASRLTSARPRAQQYSPANVLAGKLGAEHTEGGASPLSPSWLPLLAGSALVAALQPLFRADADSGSDGAGWNDGADWSDGVSEHTRETKRVGVKWPNDVHVRGEEDAAAGKPGAKLCGILCEMLPSGQVIVGFGINLLQEDWQLPTERAGSVLASGGRVGGAVTLTDPLGAELADRVISSAATELLHLVELARTRPEAARARVLRDSLTVGSEVRVHLPTGEIIDGFAAGLAEDGTLIVDRPTTGQLIVSAADIEHLR